MSVISTKSATVSFLVHMFGLQRLESHQPALGPIDYAFWAYLILE